jgi:hypothetical protein
MINEELLQKAKDLGLSDEEIAKFIQNQKDAEKYGFMDDCTHFTVQIDNNLNPDEEEEISHNNCCNDCDDCECCCDEECHCHHN